MLGQIAATKAGERRIVELCRQHGKDATAAGRLHDLSEIEMREAIRELPDGVYEGEDYLDDGGAGGEPARIHVKITIAGDKATFDLSDSADRASNFCNTTPFIARSAVAYSARIMSGREMQQNAGALRPLTIVTRPGSILEPGWTAAVAAGNHETSMRIVDAIFRAMQDAIPERLSAGGTTTASVLFFPSHADGSRRCCMKSMAAARVRATIVTAFRNARAPANTSNTPSKVIEANANIRVEQQPFAAVRWGRRGRRLCALSDSRRPCT